MSEVAVVGGYGHVGSLCVRELVQTTSERIAVMGRNAQHAERSALLHPERARGGYVDASDPRTLAAQGKSASLWVVCAAGEPLPLLDHAVATRTPLVCLTPIALERRSRHSLAERAWKAKVPLVLEAGAVPGLAGVVAQALVRGHERLDEIQIVSSGPWHGSENARRDWERIHEQWKPRIERSSRRIRSLWSFPPPIGHQRVVAAAALELEGFHARHLVQRVTYLERDHGLVARSLGRLLTGPEAAAFALTGAAFKGNEDAVPAERISLRAADPCVAAAALAALIVRAVLAGRVQPGLHSAHEAVNPGTLLSGIARRGVEVERTTPATAGDRAADASRSS